MGQRKLFSHGPLTIIKIFRVIRIESIFLLVKFEFTFEQFHLII